MSPTQKVSPLITFRVWVGGILVMLVGLIFSLWFIPVAGLGFKKLARKLHPLWAKATVACLGAKLTCHGLKHLPSEGFIAAATHHSLMDTFTYPAVIGPETCYLGKQELSRRPIFSQCFRLLENVFVERDAGEKALEIIVAHIQALPPTHNLFIHPEGTRGPEGRVRPLTPGIIKLAIETQKPIVPMVSLGGEKLWPKGALFPLPGHVSIVVGEPIDTRNWTLETYGTHLDHLRKTLHELMKTGANL
jgi:1-acyl-sn-glycerol-3-phosphate acyltransferase